MSSQAVFEYSEIFNGAQAGFASRWSATNFYAHVIFCNSSVMPQYWSGGGLARPLPGLPDSTGYDGVCVLANKVVLWKNEVFKWSASGDHTLWIPVASTAASLSVDTLEEFLMPISGSETDWVHFDDSSHTFVVGQFVRVDLDVDDLQNATYNFFEVTEVASPIGATADTIAVSQTIPAGGTGTIYTTAPVLIDSDYQEWPEGGRLLLDGNGSDLRVTDSSRPVSLLFTLAAESESVPGPGDTFQITVTENPSDLRVGDVLSLGEIAGTGLDLYEITEVGFTMTIRRLNIGTKKQSLGYKFPIDTYALVQPFLVVENIGIVDEILTASTTLTMQGAVKLKPTGSTGEVPAGTTFPAGSTISSLDANDAGEGVIAGAENNGNIYAIVPLGEYGYALKERSISVIQDVGVLNGTFFVRSEVLDEGLIARNAWTSISDSKICLWGHKNIYSYAGGAVLQPIAEQHTQKVFEELDRSRADEIVAFHNEKDFQVWFVYPVMEQSSTKVLIYNYRDDSVVLDLYDESLGGITALGAVDIETAPAWEDLEDSRLWSTEAETLRWYMLVSEGLQRQVIIAVGADASDPNLGEEPDTEIPRLLLHGRTFGRASGDNCLAAAYYCLAETQDYDFGDSSIFKYLHTIEINLAVEEELDRPMKLYVQVGSRDNLDSTIRWSAPASVEASGNGNYTTDVNIRASGRFHRIRFYSNQVGAQWKIAGFTLYARPGGAY